MTKEELITEYATMLRRALVLTLGIENSVIKEKEIEVFGNTIKEYLESFYNKIKNPEQQYGRLKPKIGEYYYYIADNGDIGKILWASDVWDLHRYSANNVFQTKEQAERVLERMKIRTQLEDIALRLNKGLKIDWNNNLQIKYTLVYNFQIEELQQNYVKTEKYMGDTYCLAGNFKDVAISEIGEERLAKYLKGE